MNLTLVAIIFIFFTLIVAWIRVAIRGGSIKKQWWPLVIAVFLGWNAFVPLAIRSATYHGKVIAEETGEPIAGAVVTVIWYHSPIIQMAQTRGYQNAQETVTGNDGSFSLWTWPGISLNPFTYVMTPPDANLIKLVTLLSVPTTYDRGYRSYERLADDLKKGVVMKTAKTKNEGRSLKVCGPGVGGDVPLSSDPKLIKEVNIHRKRRSSKSTWRTSSIRRETINVRQRRFI